MDTRQRAPSTPWTAEEDRLLRQAVAANGDDTEQWKTIALSVPGRSNKACRKRWKHSLDPSLKKTAWTKEEDELLLSLHALHPCKWSLIAQHISGRTDDACAKRYRDALDPAIKQGSWTEEEDRKLMREYQRFGGRWAKVAQELGRSGLGCRNRWRLLERKKATSSSEPFTQPEEVGIKDNIASSSTQGDAKSVSYDSIDDAAFWSTQLLEQFSLSSMNQPATDLPAMFSNAFLEQDFPIDLSLLDARPPEFDARMWDILKGGCGCGCGSGGRCPCSDESQAEAAPPFMDIAPEAFFQPYQAMSLMLDPPFASPPSSSYPSISEGGIPQSTNRYHPPINPLTEPALQQHTSLPIQLHAPDMTQDVMSLTMPAPVTPGSLRAPQPKLLPPSIPPAPAPVNLTPPRGSCCGPAIDDDDDDSPQSSGSQPGDNQGNGVQFSARSSCHASCLCKSGPRGIKRPSSPPGSTLLKRIKGKAQDANKIPRLSSVLPATSNPDILPYACGAPECWISDTDIRSRFGTSGELLEHRRAVHGDSAVGGANGKVYRCALEGCGKAWKSINGIQYHLQLSKAHFLEALNEQACCTSSEYPSGGSCCDAQAQSVDSPSDVSRSQSPGTKASLDSSKKKSPHPCPMPNCPNVYKQVAGLRYHLAHGHPTATPVQLREVPPALAQKLAARQERVLISA